MSEFSAFLEELEEERLAIIKRAKKPRLVALILVLGSVPAFVFIENNFVGGALIVAAIVSFIIGEYPKMGFTRKFKNTVIGKLVNHMHAGLQYNPTGGFHYSFLHEHGLLSRSPNQGKSEDRIHGKIGATEIDLCEQLVEKKTTTIDSKGRKQTHIEQLFKGLVVSADFNKSFQSETIIVPDKGDSGKWEWMAKKLEAKSKGGKKMVRLEDPEFEKIFTVYSTDQVESRYLLSTAFMQRLVQLHQKLSAIAKPEIFLSFKNERMILAVNWSANFFEFDFSKTVHEEVKETAEELKICTDVVEDLNLNTRIWSKQ
jgi:hypothetical protein